MPKRRRTEQERKNQILQAEKAMREEQTRRRKRKERIIMLASVATGLLAAGLIRRYLGDSVPYGYGSPKAHGWAGGGAYDPLILFGAAGGSAAGEIICRIQRRREMKK